MTRSRVPTQEPVRHTPGPWIVTGEIDRFHNGEVIRPIDRQHSPVAVLCDFNRFDRDAEREANAHLIAAAPDLLEVCKRLLYPTAATFHDTTELAKAAIAKAEGRNGRFD